MTKKNQNNAIRFGRLPGDIVHCTDLPAVSIYLLTQNHSVLRSSAAYSIWKKIYLSNLKQSHDEMPDGSTILCHTLTLSRHMGSI